MRRTDLLWREEEYWGPLLFTGSCFISVLLPGSRPLSSQALPSIASFPPVHVCHYIKHHRYQQTGSLLCRQAFFLTNFKSEAWSRLKPNTITSSWMSTGAHPHYAPKHPLSRDCFLLELRGIMSDPSQLLGASAKGTKAKAVVGKRPLFQKM